MENKSARIVSRIVAVPWVTAHIIPACCRRSRSRCTESLYVVGAFAAAAATMGASEYLGAGKGKVEKIMGHVWFLIVTDFFRVLFGCLSKIKFQAFLKNC